MTQKYIGASIRRKEDVRFLTGSAQYVDDVKLPGMLHAAILRSPHAHARITGIDPSRARAIEGVQAVFTFQDIAHLAKPIPVRVFDLEGLSDYRQLPLAENIVRYVGEPIAVVVASSRYIAEDALESIDVSFEPLQASASISSSLTDRVLIHEATGTNLAATATVGFGDVEAAFEKADYTRKEEFKTHRHTGNPLETRGMIASFDEDSGDLTMWGMTKVPHFNRGILSNHLEMPEEQIHFIEQDVGGGFGIRGEFYPEDFLIPFAAIKVGRPVKWIEDRIEHLVSANHSREVLAEVEIAAKQDGTLLGLRCRVFGDMGAYVRTHGCVVPALTAGMLTGPYRFLAYEGEINCVMTNKVGTGTYRAPGFYEACFIRERLLDMLAQDLGQDPAELRRKNLIRAEEMPYTVGKTRLDGKITVYDSGDYPAAFERALAEIGYHSLKRGGNSDGDDRRYGVGIASYVEPTGFGPYEGARLVIKEAESVEVYLGITTLGQGHETVMAQICADSLSVPMDTIRIFHGNTDYLPESIGTFGSRATVMAGNAIHLAAQTLKAQILDMAASYLDTEASGLEFNDGQVYQAGAESRTPLLTLAEIVGLAESASRVDPQTSKLDATEYFRIEDWTYAYGSHVAQVAVDPETGKVEILRYIVVEDLGRCINPMLAHGQSVGGAAQGIGGTMLEELVYSDDGQLLAGTFMDYVLPTSRDIPNIESVILEDAPSPLNPLGVKGAGEGAILATGAVLANAVADALGIQMSSLPLSPNNLRQWAQSAGAIQR